MKLWQDAWLLPSGRNIGLYEDDGFDWDTKADEDYIAHHKPIYQGLLGAARSAFRTWEYPDGGYAIIGRGVDKQIWEVRDAARESFKRLMSRADEVQSALNRIAIRSMLDLALKAANSSPRDAVLLQLVQQIKAAPGDPEKPSKTRYVNEGYLREYTISSGNTALGKAYKASLTEITKIIRDLDFLTESLFTTVEKRQRDRKREIDKSKLVSSRDRLREIYQNSLVGDRIYRDLEEVNNLMNALDIFLGDSGNFKPRLGQIEYQSPKEVMKTTFEILANVGVQNAKVALVPKLLFRSWELAEFNIDEATVEEVVAALAYLYSPIGNLDGLTTADSPTLARIYDIARSNGARAALELGIDGQAARDFACRLCLLAVLGRAVERKSTKLEHGEGETNDWHCILFAYLDLFVERHNHKLDEISVAKGCRPRPHLEAPAHKRWNPVVLKATATAVLVDIVGSTQKILGRDWVNVEELHVSGLRVYSELELHDAYMRDFNAEKQGRYPRNFRRSILSV